MNKYAFDKAVIMQGAKDLGLPEEFIRQISAYADFLQSNHHEEFFAAVLEDFFTGGKWVNAEEMPEFLQKFPGKELLFLELALAAIPLAKEHFQKNNMPLEILAEGLNDIRIWALDHRKNYGIPGLEWGHGLHWIFWRILTGQVLRFGRLECNRGFCFTDILVLRNRKTGKLQALFNSDATLDDAGFITGDAAKTIRHGVPVKKLFSEIVALPLREDGSVAPEAETFFPEEWETFLAPGENILSLHIPADGRLDIEECKASLRRMKEYFPAVNYHFKAFVCSTWFLDANMVKFAGSSSNMVKFGQLGMLVLPGGISTDVIYRVFGAKGITESPEKMTALQKNLISYFADGGVFRGGRIIIDPQTL